jgi:hypothetical protein
VNATSWRPRIAHCGWVFLAVAMATTLCAPTALTATTTTTLTVSASTVTWGTVVTLSAAVTSGSSNGALTTGLVTFCNSAAAFCEAPAVIGSAQLTSAGTAVFKFVPAVGTYSYVAVFSGVTTPAAFAKSTSSAQPLTVTVPYPSTTAISSTGSAPSYTLTGTVVGSGSLTLSPTGSVTFMDTTNGNYVLGSATLGAGTLAQNIGPQVVHGVGGSPVSVAVGDFNGDGHPDIAMANQGGSLSVLLGNGNGTFQTQVTYATGGSPYGVAVGDFNGDGKLDLAVTNNTSGTVSIYLGNGDGTFQSQVTYAAGPTPRAIAVGDFNGDGVPDLAVTDGSNSELSILLGNGNGTFGTAVTYPTGSTPFSITVGDFNGDGNLDLAVGNEGAPTLTVSVLLGNGDGTFRTQVTYAGGANPYSIVSGDFRGVGKLDLAVGDDTSTTVSVLLGNGDGTFQTRVTYPTGTGPLAAAVGDFNGDGKLDLVLANENAASVSVLLGNGDGTFQTQATYAAGTNPFSVAVADFNGDGRPDIAVADEGISDVGVLLNTATSTATAVIIGVSIPGSSSAHLIDASYPGDTNFAASTSGTISLTSTKVVTTIGLTANPTSITYGQSAVLTATLSPSAAGNLTTTGETVTFKNGAATLGTGTLSASGIATFALTNPVAATDTLTAVYAGDTNFVTSTSSVLSFTIAKAVLTVTATNLSKAYLTANPTLMYTMTRRQERRHLQQLR